MGSAVSTSIMFSHTRFTILCLFVHGISSLQWVKTTDGKIPALAAKVYPNSRTPHYFCRVKLESGSLSYGQLTDAEPACVYPGDGNKVGTADDYHNEVDKANNYHNKVGTADDYHILVSEQDTLDWVYGTQPSSRAVSCDLEVGQGSDCYLGQGVYSDGICVEALGFIKPSERNIFMTGYGKVETCPAYMFLVLED